jgi:release factor glutamine methyltransferase
MISGQRDILGALRRAEAYLTERGVPNVRRNTEWMLAHVLGIRSPELYLDPHRLIAETDADIFDELVRRRGTREPLQYILGSAEFMSLTFEMAPGVFIPRPDTEVLIERVETLLQQTDGSKGNSLLDLCCGTGIIIISLLCRNGGISGVAVDIDPAAADVTRRNAERNGVIDQIVCVTGDAIEWLESNTDRFSIITCNPPYVDSGDMAGLPPEIRAHEPALSLDGGPDGLDFYRKAVPLLTRAIATGGIVAFEIGDSQGIAVADMLESAAFADVAIHQDYNGLDRVVTARKF